MGLMLRKWNFPEDMPRLSPTFQAELTALLDHLPEGVRTFLLGTFGERLFQLSEIYMQIGQPCEAVFQNDQGITERVDMGVGRCTRDMIQLFSDLFRDVHDVLKSKRRGISGTLHRISLITHPNQSVIGVNIRVGRSFEGTLNRMIGPNGLYDLLRDADGGGGKLSSLLIIGRPGCGKTTVLREIAATLANDREKIVIVIDKTNEIAGDGESPHGCIGLARWMPVGDPTKQHEVMIEAVENQNPHILIVDEISNAAEVAAAKSIAQRGVTLIATVHGKTLPELISCGDRRALVGSSVSVTLSGKQAERRPDKRKQVEKRKHEPVFKTALEMHSRTQWIVHPSVETAIDSFLDHHQEIYCQQLTPGLASSMIAEPADGSFNYVGANHLGAAPFGNGWNAGGRGNIGHSAVPSPFGNSSSLAKMNDQYDGGSGSQKGGGKKKGNRGGGNGNKN